ncbi:MAG: hypothetical protein HY015_07120 [Bacteroidetes bacterium]|nr:hypothetical protein [Bacteroidota bacterium]MBI3482734.1 hypothetical protein [Bacteroidota bacterium]
MSTKQIIAEIDNLSREEKQELLRYLSAKLKKAEALEILSKIRGRGKNIFGIDAQEYVNKLREDDRP